MNKNKNKLIRNFDRERAEKLSEIGDRLRSVRQELDISLEEVADYTKIRLRQLQAIEEGQLEQLPEPVYIQGFIRRYADALGLDGAGLSSDFPTESNMRLLALSSWISLPTAQLRPIHLYLLYIAIIMSAVNGLSYMMNRAALQAGLGGTPESASQSLSASGQLAFKGNESSIKSISASTSSDNQSVRVGLTFKAQSWIQVVADGKIEFEGELPEGTQRTWEAKQQLIVRAGNAGGVLVAVNDGQAKQLGKPGQVEEVTIKAPNPKS